MYKFTSNNFNEIYFQKYHEHCQGLGKARQL